MGEEVLRWEVRPCQDAQGNFRCYDICLPAEPEAKGIAVVASVFSGEAVANEIAAAHNQALTAPMSEDEALERARLRKAVELAARTFRRYEELHRVKGTPDGDAKALNNAELAIAMEAALHAPGPLPVKDEDAEWLRGLAYDFEDQHSAFRRINAIAARLEEKRQ
jgi:hypothetical protein